eukprot:5786991-Pleurochrysis_carterae.AAC.1
MYMRRTSRSVHSVGRQKVGEFARQEFSCIVAVHRLVTGVVVHDHESVLAGTVDGFDEGPGNVYMDQSPGIGRSVAVVGMR